MGAELSFIVRRAMICSGLKCEVTCQLVNVHEEARIGRTVAGLARRRNATLLQNDFKASVAQD